MVTCPQAVTHRSANRARRRVTSFHPKRVTNYATPPSKIGEGLLNVFLWIWLLSTISATIYCSDFQPGFRGTQGFREHLPRVPRLVSKKDKK